MISVGPLKSKDEAPFGSGAARITVISCTIASPSTSSANLPLQRFIKQDTRRIPSSQVPSTSVNRRGSRSRAISIRISASSYARNFCTATALSLSLSLSVCLYSVEPALEISPFTFERGVTRDTIARFEHEGQKHGCPCLLEGKQWHGFLSRMREREKGFPSSRGNFPGKADGKFVPLLYTLRNRK